jgi:predicted phage terminase large subunit-like protein
MVQAQSWDSANKATELSDFSVCTTWGVKGKTVCLLGLLRQRLEYPALKRAVREQQHLYNANEILIEDKASGTQLIQESIADGCHGVTRCQPDCDKIMRMHAQTAMIENGFVSIPQNAPWLAGSTLFSTLIIALTKLDRHEILRHFCHESVRKGLRLVGDERRCAAPDLVPDPDLMGRLAQEG